MEYEYTYNVTPSSLQVDAHQYKNVAKNKPSRVNVKDIVFKNLKQLWSVKDQDAQDIYAFWEALLLHAKIEKWEQIQNNPKKYCITLSKPCEGYFSKFLFINFKCFIQRKLEFTVYEYNNKKVISFTMADGYGLNTDSKAKFERMEIENGKATLFAKDAPFNLKSHTTTSKKFINYVKSIRWK